MSGIPTGNFNYPTAYRIGCGRLRELPGAAREFGWTRPLVVTDPGVAGLAWFGKLLDGLTAVGIEPTVFSEVRGNPAAADVDRGIATYRANGCDGIVLVGGGSAMDVGKCIALLVDNPGDVFDYEDIGDNFKRADPAKIVPMIAIPTTAGTGSEVGRASVIVDERDHSKKIIFHPKMQPSLVIADPEVTFALPRGITAATGMDALAHCFEAYCAPGYHPMADGIALEGMRLVRENLLEAVANGRDPIARTHMMMAATMGATAFQKGLGLVHALSHPLGGMTNVHHGTANALFMPYVMEFNRDAIEGKMERLAIHLALDEPGFAGVLRWMLEIRRSLQMPHTLAEVAGFSPDQIERLAALAAVDPSLATNPKPCTVEQLAQLFRIAHAGTLTTAL